MADHNDRTPIIPGQRQEPPATNGHDHNSPPPAPPLDKKQPQFAALHEWWDHAWETGGFLHGRWQDLRQAPELGWHAMANWVKAALAIAGACVLVILLDTATNIVVDALHHLLTAAPHVRVGTDTSTGVFAVVDQPIRSYIAAHSAALPISASTVYTVWQVVGLFGLIGGSFRSSGARLTWTAWGAASIAMVYSTAPADGRTIATGFAVLAWTAASAIALRGLTLRPSLFIHNAAPGIDIRPQIHVPAPTAPPTDGTPDNVHPLQQR
ncbi:hypothetical protein OG345_40950 (plasmid) [Streptomyces sp. NBC_01220]|uniref:hypothetical protein n=1 Tax=Streptomyces sp. NBC_01220 TaxID=2903781 RepID=UPI002F909BFC|nr:hypothetical protein OG345_40950 [Streptomyces sp. NBC_01220]